MADGESILKFTAKSEIQELLAAEKAVLSLEAAIAKLAATMGGAASIGLQLPGGAAGGTGGAATGAPPPQPAPKPGTAPQGAPVSPAGGTGGAAAGAPPPAPQSPYVRIGMAPGWWAQGQQGGQGTGGAAAGAPPPPPLPPLTPQRQPNQGAHQPITAPIPQQSLLPPPLPGVMNPGASTPAGAPKRSHSPVMQGLSMLDRRGGSFLSQTASTAIGVGLGTSLFGLPMAALNQYMQLSTVLTQVHARFREASEGAVMFGTSMGYGIGRSAQLAEQLGNVRNEVDRGEGRRLTGLARFTGADPGAVISSMGRVATLRGREMTEADLAHAFTRSREVGMDQGRFEEFLHRYEQLAQQQFDVMGKVSRPDLYGALRMPSAVYQAGDPRRTEDTSLVQGLHSTMTGGGAMKTYMMRAMGYGQKDGPDYITMKKRLDAGVFDSLNVIDLFSSFQQRGMGAGAQFRAIESVSNGSLKAHQIEALVNSLGTREGLEKYARMATEQPGDAMAIFERTLSDKDRARWQAGGFAGLGESRVSAGEDYQNRIENIMMKVGGELAQAVPGLQGALESMGRTLVTLIAGDIGGKLERIAGALESGAKWAEGNAVPWHEGFVSPYMFGDRFGDGVRQNQSNWSRVKAQFRTNGATAAGVEYIEAGIETWTGEDIATPGWPGGDYDLTRGRPKAGSKP